METIGTPIKKLKINRDELGEKKSADMELGESQGPGQAVLCPMDRFGGADSGDDASVKPDCFGIFPEEVWLAILDKLADSRDIFITIQAFPELDKPFQSKKAYWLFDQVIPHLMTKYLVTKKKVKDTFSMYTLKSKELLKLRLVSKRWKRAVETSLQNHPDRHPTLPTNTSDDDTTTIDTS